MKKTSLPGTAAQDWVVYNGHEYYFHTESEGDDFHSARDFCQQNFGEIASILDQEEQDFIANNVSLGHPFIGRFSSKCVKFILLDNGHFGELQ